MRKTEKKIVTLALTCMLLLGAALSGPAKTTFAAASQYCNNPSCHALMTALNKYAKCEFCSRDAYAYICPNCGQAWAICSARHYKALHPVG